MENIKKNSCSRCSVVNVVCCFHIDPFGYHDSKIPSARCGLNQIDYLESCDLTFDQPIKVGFEDA